MTIDKVNEEVHVSLPFHHHVTSAASRLIFTVQIIISSCSKRLAFDYNILIPSPPPPPPSHWLQIKSKMLYTKPWTKDPYSPSGLWSYTVNLMYALSIYVDLDRYATAPLLLILRLYNKKYAAHHTKFMGILRFYTTMIYQSTVNILIHSNAIRNTWMYINLPQRAVLVYNHSPTPLPLPAYLNPEKYTWLLLYPQTTYLAIPLSSPTIKHRPIILIGMAGRWATPPPIPRDNPTTDPSPRIQSPAPSTLALVKHLPFTYPAVPFLLTSSPLLTPKPQPDCSYLIYSPFP